MKLKVNSCDGIYNSSIDIRFTKLCDNRCSFCIEEQAGFESLGKTDVDRIVASVKSGVQNEGKDTVLILGGEPFLFVDQLLDFVTKIRADVKNIYITTSLPKEFNVYDPKIHHIMENIDGLNISLHHWYWNRNNDILNATRKHDRVKQMQLAAFWFGSKIRLQCNLVKDGIESRSDVLKILKIANNAGVNEVKFNELQGVGEDLYVSFDNLFPEFRLPNPYSRGCVTDITDRFDYDLLASITVKRSCFMVQEHSPHGANLWDLLKVIIKKFIPRKRTGANVIYENGMRSAGWIQKDVLIHKEKA